MRVLQFIIAACAALLLSCALHAQSKGFTVQGCVRDTGGDTLIGVFVQIKGTKSGTTTDLDGNWKLNVPGPCTLVFQYLGMETKEVKVEKAGTYDVVLKGDNTLEEAVISAGYGLAQKRSDMTGSAFQVESSMSNMFCLCKSLLSLPDISKIDTSKVTDMSGMFECSSLLSLPDISNWDTSNVSNMCALFHNCSSLLYLPDISKWNTSNVSNMNYMFSGCKSLKFLPDISKWNITNVNKMSKIFDSCNKSLKIPEKFRNN